MCCADLVPRGDHGGNSCLPAVLIDRIPLRLPHGSCISKITQRTRLVTMNPKYCRSINQLTSTRQRRWTLGSLFLVLIFSSIFWTQRSRDVFKLSKWKGTFDLDQPPRYERLKKWEMDLPQHDLELPFPEGRKGRYVIFKNQITGLGWSNVLSEV